MTRSCLLGNILRVLYRFYLVAARGVRTNRALTRMQFGVRVPADLSVSWDFTTLVLKRALSGRDLKGQSVLEVGVGAGAILVGYLALSQGVRADGVDILPERVASSRCVAAFNHLDLRIWQSDLFQHVERRYDLIFFNTPYIPSEFGRAVFLADAGLLAMPVAWDGGADGSSTTGQFLAEAPKFLKHGGHVLVGVNRFHLQEQRTLELIARSGLRLRETVTIPFNPSAVYVLDRRPS